MGYNEANRDNIILPIEWKEETSEANFFDIRYKDMKWTPESLSQDGEVSEKFKKWMYEMIKSKDFDWIEFCDTNQFQRSRDFKEASEDVIKFEKDFLYLTEDKVIGIRYKRLYVTWTTKVDKKKGRYWYNDFLVKGNLKDGLWFNTHHGTEIQSLKDYILEENNFVKK